MKHRPEFAQPTLHALFEAQARRHPRRRAVEFEGDGLGFAELDAQADRWAQQLRALGVGPDRLVALCAQRGVHLVVAVLAVWKAAGAYLPIDPSSPPQRQAALLADSGAAVVLTDRRTRPGLPPGPARVLVLDEPDSSGTPGGPAGPARGEAAVRATSRDLAYVIHTSGSTGQPKGVMVEHAQVVHLWRAYQASVFAGEPQGLRVCLNAALHFDASVCSLVLLLMGHTLVVVPEPVRRDAAALAEWLRRRRIDVLDLTPSQLRLLCAGGWLAPGVARPRKVLVGGEAIDAPLWQALCAVPDTEFHNLYGPTECTVDATAARITGAGPHIGRPLPGTRVVLDPDSGEICIGGAGVARGYLNQSALTAERFVPDPGVVGARLYRTGDIGRWRADGALEFLGRNDGQIKIAGQRIEPGEIEAALAALPGVQQAVVTVHAAAGGAAEPELCAHLQWRADATGSPDERTLHVQGRLRERLPAALVPRWWRSHDHLPLTASDKADRVLLQAIGARTIAETRRDAPDHDPDAGGIEGIVRATWQELDGTLPSPDADLVVQGSSLRLGLFLVRLCERFEIDLPIESLLAARTPAGIAARVRRALDPEAADVAA